MATIGKLVTFNEFVKTHDIEIPRIQRDYTYGANIDKTNEVLAKLLDDIKSALVNPDPTHELILDFVYGSENQNKMFEPLDGQQRLTTLFLLQQYAAWKDGNRPSGITFHYSTRDYTSVFCQNITSAASFSYNPEDKERTLRQQIEDCGFFRNSFYDDPSICSMLFVIDEIDKRFNELAVDGKLWHLLTAQDCKVKFYSLDFGEFGLTDDLYIKMNSRGKPLTAYEIFKSKIEKYIEKTLGEKELMYDFACKFDTIYTDLVWDEMGKDKSLIDSSFINLFWNIFNLINYSERKCSHGLSEKEGPSELLETMKPTADEIRSVMSYMSVFHDIMLNHKSNEDYWSSIMFVSSSTQPEQENENKIRVFKTSVNLFHVACSKHLQYAEFVMFYALYYGYKNYELVALETSVDWKYNLRHVRNLVERSDNELPRESAMAPLMEEVELILDGKILQYSKSRFNTTQFEEEQMKARHPEIWPYFFKYENHDLLRGSLGIFLNDKTRKGLSFDNPDLIKILERRLGVFWSIFDNGAKNNDVDIRATMLSYGDFSQIKTSDFTRDRDNRMLGCLYLSWRRFFILNDFFSDSKIMSVIDSISDKGSFSEQPLFPQDGWRYYACKYRKNTYRCYNAPDYGYYYFPVSDKSLEVRIVQSSECYETNKMFKLLNNIVYWQIDENFRSHLVLGESLYDESISANFHKFKLDAVQDGWLISSVDNDTIYTWLQDNYINFDIGSGLLKLEDTDDYVDVALGVINGLIQSNSLVLE